MSVTTSAYKTVNITNDDPEPYENKTTFQGFEWYLQGQTTRTFSDSKSGVLKDESQSHWQTLRFLLPELKALGITSIWIPPACKATNPSDEGYGIYDLYDLGEFDTKGSKRTKWGFKEELQALCAEAQKLDIGIIFDAVLNHRGAADGSEDLQAIQVDLKNRMKELGSGPQTIEAWTKFDFEARNGKYSQLRLNHNHFSGVDWDSKSRQKGIWKFTGTRPDGSKKGWADDVAKTENGNYDYLMFDDIDYGNSEICEDVRHWARWLINELPGVRGYRLDAVKHYSANFQRSFVDHVKGQADATGGNFFVVGEYWLQNSKFLSNHMDKTFAGRIHMYDVRLLYNLHNLSNGIWRDLREVFNGTLVELQPKRAVTFVANHDTQECQSLAAPVEPWFIPAAYALILLRRDGHPCVFWGDVYGTNGPQPRIPACGGRLVRLVKARQLFAYGEQKDCFSPRSSGMKMLSRSHDASCIAWTRSWQHQSQGLITLAVLVSISWSWKKKKLFVGKDCAGQIYTDIMGFSWSGVLIDKDGYGDFPVGPRSLSVWTWKDAPGRTEVDGLVYPPEPPAENVDAASTGLHTS